MNRTNTFDLEDLNDDFWKKVVYFEIWPSSGLGGPGCVWFVTEDKKEYYLGFEALPFSENELGEHFPFFKQTGKYKNGHMTYEIEKEGWHYLSDKGGLVRGDIRQELQKAISDKKLAQGESKLDFLHTPDIVGLVLGTDKLERVDYIRSVILRENDEKERKEREAEREKNKLTAEHFDWKPLYPNNMKNGWTQWGWYALLFREEEGRICGTKFSIVFQRKEISPMCERWGDDEVERYNLFVKDYDDVAGPLCHPPCERASQEEYWEQVFGNGKNKMPENIPKLTFYEWITLGEYEVNDYGDFRRSFESLEEAKEYAMHIANIYMNRNTIIKDLENAARDHRLRVEKYEAYLLYRKYYREILDALCSFDEHIDDTNSGGGRFFFDAILAAVPEITERQLSLIWHDIPKVLEARTQKYIESERLNSLEYLK